MDARLLKHVLSYEDIYRFVSEQDRTEEDVKNCLENQGKAESTVRTFIQNIKKKDEPGLFIVRNGMVMIDDVKGRKLIDDLKDILSLPADDEILSNALKEVELLKEEKEKQKQEFAEKQQQLKKLQETKILELQNEIELEQGQIKEIKKETIKLKRERNKLRKQMEDKKEFVYQSINQKVLLINSIEVGPLEKPEDAALLHDVRFLVDVPPAIENVGGVREAFYTDMKADEKSVQSGTGIESGMELNEENHQRKSIRRILTELILRKRVEENVAGLEPEESVRENLKEEQSRANDTKFDMFRRQRLSYIQSIVNNKDMTNQEKLALYAFYSDFHGKDMEKLINFAGDYCINANLLIQLLESPGRACSLDNVENMLRQFSKASQVRLKQDFAKELIAGNWYIVADYNGHETKFQLVPLEEFNELRKAMDLPESKFGYNKSPLEIKQKIVETPKTIIHKPDISRFNCMDDAEEDIPNQDCEEHDNEEVDDNGK